MPVPSEEYRSRLDARRAARDRLIESDARVAYGRLAAVGGAVVLGLLTWRAGLTFWSLIVPVVAFVWLVRRHDRVLRALDKSRRAMTFYERGLARLDDRWAGGGESGERFRTNEHPYANDLDLFGRGSLFELLSLARTRLGEDTLAGWLTSPATPSELTARQEAVAELREALDLRERLSLAGDQLDAAVHTDRLLAWTESPQGSMRWLQTYAWVSAAAVAAGLAYLTITEVWWPLAIVAFGQAAVWLRERQQVDAAVGSESSDTNANFLGDRLTHRVRDLGVVAEILQSLEPERFRSDYLVQLHRRIAGSHGTASKAIARLQQLASIRESERNSAIIPLALFLFGYPEAAFAIGSLMQLARPHVAFAIGRWRARYAPEVRVWLETIGRFEALTSLSGYHFERPGDPFPELVEPQGMGVFDGRELAHPLLPAADAIRNDVRLGPDAQLYVVSGSNMSGKSTLLRTVGINAVLAFAGAPVRAASLRLSPLAIGATLRIQDSLQEGRSRFYAEIVRIRELTALARGAPPLLFLLDELFHGTNSHDRLVGASAVLRDLLDAGAIGLITTHDLALTAVADELAPRAVNVHFQDLFDGSEMQFDYRLKNGPVTRSNAIALMRAVGLNVPGSAGFR